MKNSKRMTRVGGVGGGGDGVTAESWADRSCGTEKLPSTSSVAKPPGKERAPQACLSCGARAQVRGLQGQFPHLSNGLMRVWDDVPSSQSRASTGWATKGDVLGPRTGLSSGGFGASAVGSPLSALCPPSCPVLVQPCALPLSPRGHVCSFLPVLT